MEVATVNRKSAAWWGGGGGGGGLPLGDDKNVGENFASGNKSRNF